MVTISMVFLPSCVGVGVGTNEFATWIFKLYTLNRETGSPAFQTRGPRAWRSANDFDEMERILQIFSERRKYAAYELQHP
jgi:hypothetical protein